MFKKISRDKILFFGGSLLSSWLHPVSDQPGIINNFWSTIIRLGAVYAIVSLGLNLIYGFNGQFSLGQFGFLCHWRIHSCRYHLPLVERPKLAGLDCYPGSNLADWAGDPGAAAGVEPNPWVGCPVCLCDLYLAVFILGCVGVMNWESY